MQEKPHQQRIEQLYDQNTAQSEQNQVPDPYSAVKIHGLLAVIPPAGMEALFQNIACHIFQKTAQEKRGDECRSDRRFKRRCYPHRDGNQNSAGTIDRKPRSGQKTAVDKAVKLEVFQCDLDAPAYKGIGEKQQYQVYHVFNRHFLLNPSVLRIKLLRALQLNRIRRDHILRTHSQCVWLLFHPQE